MENQVKLDASTTVTTKMNKGQAASLVNSLCQAIANNSGDLIDVKITLRNEFKEDVAIISVDKQGSLLGSLAQIVEVKVYEYEEAK